MKIGIITQSLRVNYGGILQNFALQHALKRLGHEVITLDQPCAKESYLFTFLSATRTFLLKMLGKEGNRRYPMDITPWYRNYVSQNILNFINTHIHRSRQMIGYKETRDFVVKSKIEALVVGSDQVWRPKFNMDICHSYLDFAENLDVKRVAYAASFGVDTWEYSDSERERCSALAKLFDGISVRERSGVELCRKYLNVDSQFVWDPTLLLTCEDYKGLVKGNGGSNRGIGVYLLDKSEEKLAFINGMAARLGKEVYYIGKVDENGVIPSVESWIEGFMDADTIITDSFHGSVFSIIFNKEFYTLANEARGTSRFDSLLGVLGLQERMIKAPFAPVGGANNIIEWNRVNCEIEKMRETSINFLKKNLL